MYILQFFSSPVYVATLLLAIVIAVTFHEFAHAWTADRLGDETPRLQGRVTLSPSAHLDPTGSILFLIFGFGWGRPVMYNPMRLSRRSDELLIALAGPASNLVLAFAFVLLQTVASRTGVNLISTDLLEIAVRVNLGLAAFNLIPVPPLDGSSIIAYFWPDYRSLVTGQAGLIVLLVLLFLPIGPSGSIVDTVLPPITTFFWHLVHLFGALG